MAQSVTSAPSQAGIPFANGGASSDRLVVQESTLSLVVKDVRAAADQVLSYAKDVGGYMVASTYNNQNESPFAQVTVRVPSEKLDEALAHLRGLAIKVSSENLVGYDITDQYRDLDARLATLKDTKKKFEAIMNDATRVQDILEVERQLMSLQDDIDRVTGAQIALADSAKMTKITLYLSTDELSLPYAPDSSFRPSVVFKQAVRSLVGTLRGLEAFAIWIGVYAVLWVPLLILILVWLWKTKRTTIG